MLSFEASTPIQLAAKIPKYVRVSDSFDYIVCRFPKFKNSSKDIYMASLTLCIIELNTEIFTCPTFRIPKPQLQNQTFSAQKKYVCF